MIVRVVVLAVRPRAARGEIVMIASGMPSLFSSTGSVASVALGKATPLTMTVAGLIWVTGAKGGVIVGVAEDEDGQRRRRRGVDGEDAGGGDRHADADLGRDLDVQRDVQRE